MKMLKLNDNAIVEFNFAFAYTESGEPWERTHIKVVDMPISIMCL